MIISPTCTFNPIPMSRFLIYCSGGQAIEVTLPSDTKEWKIKELCSQHLYHPLYSYTSSPILP